MIGRRFGRWTVVAKSRRDNPKYGWAMWDCVCDCGNRGSKLGAELRRGKTQSCGCLRVKISGDLHRKHGLEGTPVYHSWASMIQRCSNPNFPHYSYYGGRGIKVCKRWKIFANFYADMGERPKELTLERINNQGNYEPSNCKWATKLEQAGNTRANVIVTINGRSQCIAAWARELGLPNAKHVRRNDVERLMATKL